MMIRDWFGRLIERWLFGRPADLGISEGVPEVGSTSCHSSAESGSKPHKLPSETGFSILHPRSLLKGNVEFFKHLPEHARKAQGYLIEFQDKVADVQDGIQKTVGEMQDAVAGISDGLADAREDMERDFGRARKELDWRGNT